MFIISKKAGKKGSVKRKKNSRRSSVKKKCENENLEQKANVEKLYVMEETRFLAENVKLFFLLSFLPSTSFGCEETIKEWFSISE